MRIGFPVLLLFLLAVPAPAPAADEFVGTEGFLLAHRDLYWRNRGIEDYQSGRLDSAVGSFTMAARFADKTSQAMLAQMYWNGEGRPVDRVLGYIWADLAAERGYPDLVATRERFWAALSDVERQSAVREGERIFDEYGDEKAKPRMERTMRAARLNVTGSRTGRVGTLGVSIQISPDRWMAVDGDRYYSAKYWTPELYWDWADAPYRNDPRGKVTVEPIIPQKN